MYLQLIYLPEDLYPEYINNSFNSTIKDIQSIKICKSTDTFRERDITTEMNSNLKRDSLEVFRARFTALFTKLF